MPDQNATDLAVIALVVSILNILISIYLARRYGDVAGAKKVIEHEKTKADEARISAFQSLINEVERIRKLADHNSQLDPDRPAQSIARMPVAAFQTAFVSGMVASAVSQELLDAATDYLACADSINTLVDVYVAASPSGGGRGMEHVHGAVRETKEVCTNKLPGILDRLGDALQDELDIARGKLRQ